LGIALATYEQQTVRDSDLDFLAPALRRRGMAVEAPAWTDATVDWGGFDLVLVSSTWDYHRQLEGFREWLAAVDGATTLRNPLPTIEWNLDKRYLRDLDAAGVPTIPTIWTEPGTEDEIEAAVAELGWGDVVLKPVVDLGAERLARVETKMVARILRSLDEPGMAQPFLPSVEAEGELSLVFIEGEPTHCVRKRPAQGDFRVQPQYGASHERVEPPAEAVRIGRRALERAPGAPLYARVDMLSDAAGGLRVVELELIEPNLYLAANPGAADALAAAMLTAARAS
jgi:glutathione synthase/RimK-type ligase-like ATP-grasp enzyme